MATNVKVIYCAIYMKISNMYRMAARLYKTIPVIESVQY